MVWNWRESTWGVVSHQCDSTIVVSRSFDTVSTFVQHLCVIFHQPRTDLPASHTSVAFAFDAEASSHFESLNLTLLRPCTSSLWTSASPNLPSSILSTQSSPFSADLCSEHFERIEPWLPVECYQSEIHSCSKSNPRTTYVYKPLAGSSLQGQPQLRQTDWCIPRGWNKLDNNIHLELQPHNFLTLCQLVTDFRQDAGDKASLLHTVWASLDSDATKKACKNSSVSVSQWTSQPFEFRVPIRFDYRRHLRHQGCWTVAGFCLSSGVMLLYFSELCEVEGEEGVVYCAIADYV